MESSLISRASLAGAVSLALVHSASAVSVLITVDNTGANDPVSIETPRTWNFAIKAGYSITVGRASFGLNDGVNTVEDITFKVWEGLGGDVPGNNLLTTVGLTAAQVDGFFTTLENFDFGPLVLNSGYYSITLTTNAASGNQSYFLKNGSAVLKLTDEAGNDTGTVLGSEYWIQDANDDGTATSTLQSNEVIPEPASILLSLGSAILLLRRKRS